MVTIRDVSKWARVSKSTVSRYISDNGYVSDAKRKAIEVAIRELGYRPNRNARGLRSNRSNIIGGVVIDLTSPFYAQLVGGMQLASRDAGKGLLLSSGFGAPQEEERAVLDLVDRSCDGLLLNLEFPLSSFAQDALAKTGIPVVMIGTADEPVAAASVTLNNIEGARVGMAHLLAHGHRKILHLGGVKTHRDTQARIKGIEIALVDADMSLADIIVKYHSFTEGHGYKTVRELITAGVDFTAIFAGDDDIAAGAIMALKEAGISIPEDVSIIGFDDNFHARHLTPALTTVRQPIGRVGGLAAQILLNILDGKIPEHRDLVVPTELIMRGSVADNSQMNTRLQTG